jgi:hypothetical protein
MIFGTSNEGRPRGRGRFILEDGIEVDVKEIMYVVIELWEHGNGTVDCIQTKHLMETEQVSAYNKLPRSFN